MPGEISAFIASYWILAKRFHFTLCACTPYNRLGIKITGLFDSIVILVSDTSTLRIVNVSDRGDCDVKGRGNYKEGHVIEGTCQILDSGGWHNSQLQLKRVSTNDICSTSPYHWASYY